MSVPKKIWIPAAVFGSLVALGAIGAAAAPAPDPLPRAVTGEWVAETTVPETTVPETTIPETTIPVTTIPVTTIPVTTIPVTTIPVTTTTVSLITTPAVDPALDANDRWLSPIEFMMAENVSLYVNDYWTNEQANDIGFAFCEMVVDSPDRDTLEMYLIEAYSVTGPEIDDPEEFGRAMGALAGGMCSDELNRAMAR